MNIVLTIMLFVACTGCKAFNLVAWHGYTNEINRDTISIQYKKDSTHIDTIRSVKKYHYTETNPRTLQTAKWWIPVVLIAGILVVLLIRNPQ